MAIYYGNTSLSASGIDCIYVGNNSVYTSSSVVNLTISSTQSNASYNISLTKLDTRVLSVYLNDTLYQTTALSGEVSINLTGISGENIIKIDCKGTWNFNTYILGSAISNADLADITFSSGIKMNSLPANAFNGCTNLISIALPNKVTSIGSNAFYNCTSLTNLILPNSLETIADGALSGCSSLNFTEHTTGKYLSSLNNEYLLFFKALNTSITTCSIPNITKIIYTNAFNNCIALTELYIRGSVTCIPGTIIENCSSLTIINCEATTKPSGWVNNWAGDTTATITWGYLPGSVGLLYVSNTGELTGTCYVSGRGTCTDTTIIIPKESPLGETVISIGPNAFLANVEISKIIMPNTITTIDKKAFYMCINLSSITFSNSLTTIDTEAFNYCSSLDTIVLPNTVLQVAANAFSNCTNLANISMLNLNITVNQYAFTNCNNIQYIKGSVDALVEATAGTRHRTQEITAEILDGVTTIPSRAFQNFCPYVSKINYIIPPSITTMLSEAFTYSRASKVYINDIVSWLNIIFYDQKANPIYSARNLYLNNELLTNLVIPDTVALVRTNALAYCESLISIDTGSSVNRLFLDSFANCTSLESIILGPSLSIIDSYVFENCTSLLSINIPQNITSIGTNTFCDCTNLAIINIDKPAGSIEGAPWGAPNATVIWND